MKTKKISTLILLLVSFIVIAVCIFKLLNLQNKLGKEDGNYSWVSEYIDSTKDFLCVDFSDDSAMVALCTEIVCANVVVSSDELESFSYDSTLVFWDGVLENNTFIYGSLVPFDCAYVIVNDNIVKPKTVTIEDNGKMFFLKYVLCTTENFDVNDVGKVVMVDNNLKQHSNLEGQE